MSSGDGLGGFGDALGVSSPLSPSRSSSPTESTALTVVSSPRIGTGGLGPLDLDEVEYTAPADTQQYWVQNCQWMKQPRVRQFLRPKFCAIVFTLTLTGCFLALAVALMAVPSLDDNTAPVVEDPSLPDSDSDSCVAQEWAVGALLVRDPWAPRRLMVLQRPNSSVEATFRMTQWDVLGVFDGTDVLLYGPDTLLTDADDGAGAMGPRDRSETFNSWGALPERWNVDSNDAWYGRQRIPVWTLTHATTDDATGSTTSGDSSASSLRAAAGSGGADRSSGSEPDPDRGQLGRGFFDDNPFWKPTIPKGTSADSSSTGAAWSSSGGGGPSAPSAVAQPSAWYLFNNRTDVHVGPYELVRPVTPPSPSTAALSSTGVEGATGAASSTAPSSFSSSTGASEPTPPATDSDDDPVAPLLPLYRLRLFVSEHDRVLRMCGDRFVQPVASHSSSSGGASSLDLSSSSTGTSAETGVDGSS